MVVQAIVDVVGFYEKLKFRKNGPLAGKLQPMIKGTSMYYVIKIWSFFNKKNNLKE